MYSTNKLCVVGDRLKDFSKNPNAITISALEELIETNVTPLNTDKYHITVGQGIREQKLNELRKKISLSHMENIFEIQALSHHTKSNGQLTHKKKTENIMISEPIKNDESTYECALMLDDNCAEMSDHVTGQHIQGMVLVEAARQMVIAVTEKYFINAENKRKLSFMTHNMDTAFHQFVFPLGVTIKYQILEIKQARNNNLSSKVLISFIQNDEIAAEITFKYSALDAAFIAEKETFLAEKSIQAYLDQDTSYNNVIFFKKAA